MLYLGSYISGYGKADTALLDMSNIQNTAVNNGTFAVLYITVDTSDTAFDSGTWDYNTVLIARFNGDLSAGNIAYQLEQVNAVRIKRRKRGEYAWNTLYEKPIASVDDLKFDYYDRFAANNTEYEYAAVPVLNGAEGRIDINVVRSDFDGCFIMEKDTGYHAELDVEKGTIQRNGISSVVTTLSGRYPVIVSNGNSDYYSGTMRAMFLPYDSKQEPTKVGAYEYRERLMNFLTNKKPKILKLDDGRVFIASIVGNIQDENDRLSDYVHTSFDWVEIGSATSSTDLYNNGFIDVNVEGD